MYGHIYDTEDGYTSGGNVVYDTQLYYQPVTGGYESESEIDLVEIEGDSEPPSESSGDDSESSKDSEDDDSETFVVNKIDKEIKSKGARIKVKPKTKKIPEIVIADGGNDKNTHTFLEVAKEFSSFLAKVKLPI